MSELMDLYQEVILDHNKKPRNRGTMDDADHEAKGDNPLCGDQLTLYLKMDGDRVTGVETTRGLIETDVVGLAVAGFGKLGVGSFEAFVGLAEFSVGVGDVQHIDGAGRKKHEKRGGWRVEEEFVNAVRSLEPVTHTDLATAVRYMEWTDAVTRSLRTGWTVELPLSVDD